jgi:Large polyvalent protein associated domain 38
VANVLLSPDQIKYLQSTAGLLQQPEPTYAPAAAPVEPAAALQAAPAAPNPLAAPAAPPPPATPAVPAQASAWEDASPELTGFLQGNKFATMKQFREASFAKRSSLIDKYASTDAFRAKVLAAGGETETDMALAKGEFKRKYLGAGGAPSEFGLHTMANPAIAAARAVTGFGKGVSDLFGADNSVSGSLDAASKWLTSKMSAGQLELDKQRDEEMAAATSQTERAMIALKFAARSPLTSVGEAAGSLAPIVLATVGGVAVGGAALGAAAATGLATAVGAGTVKGNIYETVKNAPLQSLMGDAYFNTMLKSGMDEKAAREILATARQSYAEAPAEIAFGGVVAAVASRFGASGEVTKQLTKQVAIQAARETVKKGTGVSLAKAGLGEALQEAVEGGSTRVASNYAAARGGADIAWNEGLGEEIGGVLVGSAGVGAGVRYRSRVRAEKVVAADDASNREVERQRAAADTLAAQATATAQATKQAEARAQAEQATNSFYDQVPENTRAGFRTRMEAALVRGANILNTEDATFDAAGENTIEQLRSTQAALREQVANISAIYAGDKDKTALTSKTKRYMDAITEIDGTIQSFEKASQRQAPAEPAPIPDNTPNPEQFFPAASAQAQPLFEKRFADAIAMADSALGSLKSAGPTDAESGVSVHDRIRDVRERLVDAQTALGEVYSGQADHKVFVAQNQKYIKALDAIDSATQAYSTVAATDQATRIEQENDAAERAALESHLSELSPKYADKLTGLSPFEVREKAQAWLKGHYSDEDYAYLKDEIDASPAEMRTGLWLDSLSDAMSDARNVDAGVAVDAFVSAGVASEVPLDVNPITEAKLNEVGLSVTGDTAAQARAALAAVYTADEFADLSERISDLPTEYQDGEWVHAAMLAAGGKKVSRSQKAEAGVNAPTPKESMQRYKAVILSLSDAIGQDVRSLPQIKVMPFDLANKIAQLRNESGLNSLGFMNPLTGEIYINSWATPPQDAFGVLLHETAHKRLYLDMSPEEVKAAFDQVQTWAQSPEGSIERRVFDRAAANIALYKEGDRNSEWLPMTIGYAAWELKRAGIEPTQTQDNSVAGWVERVRTWFAGMLAKVGIIKAEAAPLSAQDLLDMSIGLLKTEVQNRGTSPAELTKLRGLIDDPTRIFAQRAEERPAAGKAPKRTVTYAEAVDMQDKVRATASRAPDGTWTINTDGTVTTVPSFDAMMDAFSDAGLRYKYRAKDLGAHVGNVQTELELEPRHATAIQQALSYGVVPEALSKITALKRMLAFRYVNRLEGFDRLDALRGVRRGDKGSLVDRIQLDKSKIDAELLKPGMGADSIADSLLDVEKALKGSGITTDLMGQFWYAINAKERHAYLSSRGPFLDSNGKVKTAFTGLHYDGTPDDDGSRTLASPEVMRNLAQLEAASEFMREAEQRVSEAEYRSGVIDKATFDDRQKRNFVYAPFRTYNPEQSLAGMESATGRSSQADNPYIVHQATMAARMSRAMSNETRTAIAEGVLDNMSPAMAQIIKPIGELQLDRRAVTPDVPAEWIPVSKAEGTIVYYRNGKPYGLQIIDPNLRKTMKYVEADGVVRFIGSMRNFYQGTLTRWNPAFLVKAAGWDMFTAYANSQAAFGTQNIDNAVATKFANAVVGNAIRLMPAALKRGVMQQTDKTILQLFVSSGGELSFADRYADNRADLASLGASANGLLKLGNKATTATGAAAGAVFRRLEGGLQFVEEAVRAGGFKAFLEHKHGGKFASDEELKEWAKANPEILQQAAIGSKRLVTNFEQTGDANGLRTWLLFFNPAMQGAFSVIPSMLSSTHGRKVASLIGTIAMLAAAGASDDRDVDEKAMFTRTKGFGDKLVFGDMAVDMPPELRPFVAMGYAAVGVMRGHLDEGEAIALVANKTIDAMSPFRVTHEGPTKLDWMNRAAYTVAGPLQFVAPGVTGKDYFGKPIESNAGLRKGEEDTRPKFTKGRASDSEFGTALAKWAYAESDGAVNTSPFMADAVLRNIGGGWAGLAMGVTKEMNEGKSISDALTKKLGAAYVSEHNKHEVRGEYESLYKELNAKLYSAVMEDIAPNGGVNLLMEKRNAIVGVKEEIDSVAVGGVKLSKLREALRAARTEGRKDDVAMLQAQIDIGMQAQNQLMGRALIKYRAVK